MTASPGKAPKKEKEKKQSPAERLEGLRYNHMMYGPTAGELGSVSKKVNYGASYLKHPKFQALITALKKGEAYQFDVTDKGKVCTISTDGSQLSFDGKMIFYSRVSTRHEDHLLLDKLATVHLQTIEALVHFVFAVLRSFPDTKVSDLTYRNRQVYFGAETLEAGISDQGQNLLMGSYEHNKAQEKARK